MLNRTSILALFLCLITFQAFGATWYAGPSSLKRAGTYLNMGNILDYSGKAFLPKPSIGAYEIEEVLDRTAATTRSSRN